tara:strand:- start:313 stop:525 length:213 start_codon:yes stop_codon:yes gene_type:complete
LFNVGDLVLYYRYTQEPKYFLVEVENDSIGKIVDIRLTKSGRKHQFMVWWTPEMIYWHWGAFLKKIEQNM